MKIPNKKFAIIAAALAVLILIFYLQSNFGERQIGSGSNSKDTPLQSDFTGAKIKPEDLIDGCPFKDCIPSIDSPKFDKARNVTWLNSDDVVLVLRHKGIQRAYPQKILNWHEIVNDQVAGDPIAITFCPLCGSAVAFERKVNGKVVEFGVSGKLHNSDLVMYDRLEGNLWQQITGEAIVGPAARRNEKLKPVILGTTTWGQWKKDNPDADVLSRDTGHSRDYNRYPYGTYEKDDQLYFGVENLNSELPLKEVVYGVEIKGASRAYPASVFKRGESFEDRLGDVRIRLEQLNSGDVKVTIKESGEEIAVVRLFWFAWAAFHPETDIYTK